MTSGYAPLGAMIASDRLAAPFLTDTSSFLHGVTFGGHPVSAAVALANLDIFEREDLNGRLRANEKVFQSILERLLDLPIVGDVRGDGYFYGIELVKDKATKETFDDAESEWLLRGFLSKALFENGLYSRADDRATLWCGSPAANLRRDPRRRDGADPPVRAHRGLDPHLTAMSYRDLSYSMSSVDDELTPLPSLDGDLDVDVAIVGTTDGTGEPESLRWLGINAAAQAMAAADRAETRTGTTARRAPAINRRLGR